MIILSKVIRLLKYLKWHSNKDNPLERRHLRNDPNLSKFLGGKHAQTTAFKDLHEGLNTDYDERLLDEEDWRVVISGLKIDPEEKNNRLGSMYYNHPFSHDEIDLILEGIWSIKTISNNQAEILTERIKQELGDKFYAKEERALFTRVFKEQESTAVDKEIVQDNLQIIHKAIDTNKQIEFNLYSWYSGEGEDAGDVKFIPRDKNPNLVSPYYIVFDDGKYYLLANTEQYGEEAVQENRMSVWRIDLMNDIEILHEKRTPNKEVENLPEKLEKTFNNEHINIAYDDPKDIEIKISHHSGEERSIDYKFIYDWFGDYQFIKEDKKDYYGHIIKVQATEFAIVNWALQYNQEVEILNPLHIRETIKEKIKNLNNKYS